MSIDTSSKSNAADTTVRPSEVEPEADGAAGKKGLLIFGWDFRGSVPAVRCHSAVDIERLLRRFVAVAEQLDCEGVSHELPATLCRELRMLLMDAREYLR